MSHAGQRRAARPRPARQERHLFRACQGLGDWRDDPGGPDGISAMASRRVGFLRCLRHAWTHVPFVANGQAVRRTGLGALFLP